MKTVITDALCTFCGCLCDDITIVVEDNRIIEAKHASILGSAKILGTAYRMDGVSLRLRKMNDSNHPTDEEVLLKMIKRVKEISLMK